MSQQLHGPGGYFYSLRPSNNEKQVLDLVLENTETGDKVFLLTIDENGITVHCSSAVPDVDVQKGEDGTYHMAVHLPKAPEPVEQDYTVYLNRTVQQSAQVYVKAKSQEEAERRYMEDCSIHWEDERTLELMVDAERQTPPHHE